MWKDNWEETKKHFADWWNHKGLVVSGDCWGPQAPAGEWNVRAREKVEEPKPESNMDPVLNPEFIAKYNHYQLSRHVFSGDTLPISSPGLGPGSLALFLGSEPGFSKETVWYEPCIHDCAEPEKLPPLKFDEKNKWWKLTEDSLKACARLARGKYLVGCPDLIENIDILASLRNAQTLLVDMIERPEWVEQKVREINQVFFEAYSRVYDIIRLDDGSSAFGPFSIWGPGKTAKLQCDASAMFSPDMFRRFVAPSLTEQCKWLDCAMYHLDGTQAVCHLDALLEIDALDAIEWTPQAGIEGGGNPRWYELYRRILSAGKSVQVVGIDNNEVIPLLDAIGGKGVYILTSLVDPRKTEKLLADVEKYR